MGIDANAPAISVMKSRRLMSHQTEVSYRFAPEPAHKIAIKRPVQCPLWVKSRHMQCKKAIRFPPESDIKRVTWNGQERNKKPRRMSGALGWMEQDYRSMSDLRSHSSKA